MNDGYLLLKAILANPDSDGPRIPYSDWCQEHGQGERGEFINQQIDLHRERRMEVESRLIPVGLGLPDWIGATRPQDSRFDGPLLRRAYFEDYVFVWERGFLVHLEMPLRTFRDQSKYLFRRHPITSVRLTDANPDLSGSWGYGWLNANALLEELPTANPDQEYSIPGSIWRLLPEGLPESNTMWRFYPNVEEANKAISLACCLWARNLAEDLPATV